MIGLFWIIGLLPVFFDDSQWVPITYTSIEICDNAVDDDGDGLIDLNDEDCFCSIIEPVSLIPNPSFEDQDCCPLQRSKMDCATTWIQASAPTTDYIHTCGWLGWEHLPMPMPVPDGEGAIGFRDGRFGMNSNPNWKEYAGACLSGPLRAGVQYTFQFYIGFTRQLNSPPINVTFFGTTNCEHLPFGGGDDTFGCPTNGPGWIRMGSVSASGTDEWKKMEINVKPPVDISAIAIGPDCPERMLEQNPYYFFDNLILAEQSAFEFEILANDQPCSQEISFSLPAYDTLSYQWYKDGIALKGETKSILENPPGEGRYQVMIDGGEECQVTKTFLHRIPVVTNQISQTICEGESFLFNNQKITREGIYWDTLKTLNNCDSIIQLNLRIDQHIESEIDVKIFPFESYSVGNYRFDRPGSYVRTIASSFGCDSTVYLNLGFYSVYSPNVFSPNGDGLNDFFNLNGDQDFLSIKILRIFSRWGEMVYEGTNLKPNVSNNGWDGNINGMLAPEALYVFTADIVMDDQIQRTIAGTVTLLR